MRKAFLIAFLLFMPVSVGAQNMTAPTRPVLTVDGLDESEGDCERMTDQVRVQGRLGGFEEWRILELLAPLRVGKTESGEDAYCVKHFFRECPKVIESFYFQNGYPETKVEINVSSFTGDRPSLFVRVDASKGCEIGKVTIESDGRVGTWVVADCMPSGEAFSIRENPQARFEPRMRAVLKEAGISNPDIVILPVGEEMTPDHRLRTNFLVFIEKEKSNAVIADIQLAGLYKTRPLVARRELLISPGDRFRPSMLEYSLKNLRQLGFFTEVKVESLSYEHQGKGIVIVISFKEIENRQPVSFSPGIQP
jgi:outer membrane protein assembly factor BamA